MNHAQNFVASKAFQDSQLVVYNDSIEGILIHESGWNALIDTDWDRFHEWTLPIQNITQQMHDIIVVHTNGIQDRRFSIPRRSNSM